MLCRALITAFLLRTGVLELGPFQERLEKDVAEAFNQMSKPAGEVCRRKERLLAFGNRSPTSTQRRRSLSPPRISRSETIGSRNYLFDTRIFLLPDGLLPWDSPETEGVNKIGTREQESRLLVAASGAALKGQTHGGYSLI